MSSSHIVIVARNTETGEVKLPLGDMTLYGAGEEEQVLQTCAMSCGLGEDWVLTLYHPVGPSITAK